MARGERGAVWQYEDKLVPTAGLSVAAGKEKEEFSPEPVSFDDMRASAKTPAQAATVADQAAFLDVGARLPFVVVTELEVLA